MAEEYKIHSSVQIPALGDLPLILAGPIVRRVKPDKVTVWVALKEAKAVTFRVYENEDDAAVMVGVERTVSVGDNLHIVAVTADAEPASDDRPWGSLCLYNLFFEERPDEAEPLSPSLTTAESLLSNNILVMGAPADQPLIDRLLYPKLDANGKPTEVPHHGLPSFVLPSEALNELRIFYASCRKPHGEGKDMLAWFDQPLGESFSDSGKRPQQLYMTGDQVYSDDVADVLLLSLMDASIKLLGWGEELPGIDDYYPDVENKWQQQPMAGIRKDLVKKKAKFTSRDSFSHLLTFGEYCAMHLFAWSPVLWPRPEEGEPVLFRDLDFLQLFPDENLPRSAHSRFLEQGPNLDQFRQGLAEVRRVLANISTYMMFDDHEITDDWNLSKEWVDDVNATALGPEIIRNGLAAYALCQAWGNDPDRFLSNEAGGKLLNLIAGWQTTSGNGPKISDLVTAKPVINADGELEHNVGALDWHYQVDGSSHVTAFLDTRTLRTMSIDDADDPPILLSKEVLEDPPNGKPIIPPSIDGPESKLLFVVSPAPVFNLAWPVFFRWFSTKSYGDWEDWENQERAVPEFLSHLLKIGHTNALLLGGDVHHGFAQRLDYEQSEDAALGIAAGTGVYANLVASALKNTDSNTRKVHDIGNAFWWNEASPDIHTHPNGKLKFTATYLRDTSRGEAFLDGTEAVGLNNIGELTLSVANNQKSVTQTLHWWGEDSMWSEDLPAHWVNKTTYTVSLI